jgi:calcineurin-like phosphoesterase family protein
MNIWFSSDWHISHKNITGPKISNWSSGYRDFDSTKEMDDTILDTINKYVKKDDLIYFLGDFCFGDHTKTPFHRSRIVCKNIHALIGNHDEHIDLYKDCFLSLNDTLHVKHGQTKIFMSHYSHRVWQGHHKGVIHLYGHSHGSIPDYGKSMDVGIDVAKRLYGEYRPFHLDEIVKIMEKRDVVMVDHHV